MRRILIEQARRKRTRRRGGRRSRCEIREADRVKIPVHEELLDLDEVVDKLTAVEPDVAAVVKFRLFAVMTVEKIADIQGLSPRTVKRNWAYTRAWLGRELAKRDK